MQIIKENFYDYDGSQLRYRTKNASFFILLPHIALIIQIF